ncbi:MAG: class I SAM-dependent RNA methyltransferase [Zetaproteobacteria bacterium]|nr:MAG: class I SAM-dependent RNA methyltransferase [Zetaproteobacteria bacterium]
MGGLIRGRAQRLLVGGEALVRHGGNQTTLVGGALPGEEIRFHPSGRHRGAARGRLAHVDTPAAERITPRCPVAGECGGCALLHLHPAEHGRLQREWIEEHYRRALPPGRRAEPLPGAPDRPRSRCRRRLRWHLESTQGRFLLGFHAVRSRKVVDAAGCITADPLLAGLHPRILHALERGALPPFTTLTATRLEDGIHLLLDGCAHIDEGDPPFTEQATLPLQWWRRGDDGGLRPWGRPVHTFHDMLPSCRGGSIALEIGPDDFIQSDAEANRAMIRWIIEQAGPARHIVDLFCGAGNCSLPLARPGRTIVGADADAASVARAERNARRIDAGARYRTVDLLRPFDPAPFAGADLLLLDPPRKGARRVVAMIQRLLPKRVIMIHCDPASGGRDATLLAEAGWRMEGLFSLEMFSWSGRVETISLWRHPGPERRSA